jgi:uncharacterized membrane protein YbaN (DUF454 family)
MKWVAAIAITLSLSFSALVLVDNTVVRVVLVAVGVFAVWFVFTRPTRTVGHLTEAGAPDFSPR